MDLSGQYIIPAPRQLVWDALNDTEILKQCIPGCETVTRTSDTSFEAKVTAKVGPVRAKFSGEVNLTDINPPNSYKISGEGTGGAAGFAKGGATVKLIDTDEGTKLEYVVDATVGGKLAQIGSRLIDSTSKKMANAFFENFVEIVKNKQSEGAQEGGAANIEIIVQEDAALAKASDLPDRERGISPFVWVTGVIILLLGIVFITQG